MVIAGALVRRRGDGPGAPLAPDRPLTFVDADGRTVRSTDFAGKWLLVYFGYTHCSDLCPTGSARLPMRSTRSGRPPSHVQPLFVTVDPERDKGPCCAPSRKPSTSA